MVFGLVRGGLGYLCSSVARFLGQSFRNTMGCFLACIRSRRKVIESSDKQGVSGSKNRLPTQLQEQPVSSISKNLKEKVNVSNCSLVDNVSLESSKFEEGEILQPSAVFTDTASKANFDSGKPEDQQSVAHGLKDSKSSSRRLDSIIEDEFLAQLEKADNISEKEKVSIISDGTPSSCISSEQTKYCDNPDEASSISIVHDNTEASTLSSSPSISRIMEMDKSIDENCDFGSTNKTPLVCDNGSKGEFSAESVVNKSNQLYQDPPLQIPEMPESEACSGSDEADSHQQCKRQEETCASDSSRDLQDSIPNKPEASGEDTSTTTEYTSLLSSERESAASCEPSTVSNDSSVSKNSRYASVIDRPIIIGMLDAHWHCRETSDIRPKWWNGNGIPNSTTKYKEDQKVNWHATPFEERLERALYREDPQKKHIKGRPLTYDGCEEGDATLSRKIVPSHSASVESF